MWRNKARKIITCRRYNLQLLFTTLFVIKLYLCENRAFCIQFSVVPLCDAPARSQLIVMIALSVTMAMCLCCRTGYAKLKMGPLERSLVLRLIQSLVVLKNSKCSKKNDLWKELSTALCTSKFTSAEKAVGNLLLIGQYYKVGQQYKKLVVHAFKMREGIHLFFGNTCFISETSKSLNCLDNGTCQNGNSFEVLCSSPFLELGLGEQSWKKQGFLQVVLSFLLYRAAVCQFGVFRSNNFTGCQTLCKQGPQEGWMMPALTEHWGGGCFLRNRNTAAICTEGACWQAVGLKCYPAPEKGPDKVYQCHIQPQM